MADETNIHDFVHERFSRLDAKVDRLLAVQETTNVRLASLETRITGVEAAVVHVQERLDGIQAQMDNVTRRLERIERRLDLTNTPAAG